MTRPTLKLNKPTDRTARPKALTTRARRAAQDKSRSAPPAASAPAPAPDEQRQPSPVLEQAMQADPRPAPEAPERASTGPAATSTPPAPSRPWIVPAEQAPEPVASRPAGARVPAKPWTSRTQRPRTDVPGASTPRPSATGQARADRSRPESSPVASGKGRPATARTAVPSARPARAAQPEAPRTPRHENPDDPRLSKRMSELGLCSRREADEWIVNGWVKVDGRVVDTLGVRVAPDARIEIDPAAARHQSELVTILLNKPVGYVSGQPEDGHEPAMVLIRPENRWAEDPSPTKFKNSHLRGLAPAGRLDIDSTGLLVFTQDGRIARHLIGQDSEVEKEYLVRVEGALTDEGMRLLQHGLELDGVKLKPARVSWQNEHQLRFVLREGRKRQIRRMCELVGLVVTGLKRVRSGSVPLGPLPVGQWRYLRRDEKF